MSIEFKRGIFTDLTLSGAGFATFDDGKQAFISPSIVLRTQVQVGDEVDCRLAPNYEDKATPNCPWRCFYMTVVGGVRPSEEEPEDQEPRTELRPRLLEFFKAGGAWTVGEVFEELYGSRYRTSPPDPEAAKRYAELANNINGLARQGYLAVAKIHGPGTSRAWRSYFSMDRTMLVPQGAIDEEEPVDA